MLPKGRQARYCANGASCRTKKDAGYTYSKRRSRSETAVRGSRVLYTSASHGIKQPMMMISWCVRRPAFSSTSQLLTVLLTAIFE